MAGRAGTSQRIGSSGSPGAGHAGAPEPAAPEPAATNPPPTETPTNPHPTDPHLTNPALTDPDGPDVANAATETEPSAQAGAPRRAMRADARRNYERVLDAARKVFADQGGGASMEAIAKQAGVGVGTLYRHFPKRIDVVEAVYRDDVDVLVGTADRGLAELEPWDALEAWLRAYVDYAASKRTFLTELHEAFEKNPDLKPLSRERITAACDRVLARAQEAGEARDDIDGADLMQLVSPMCVSPTLERDQGDRLLRMILDGLHPPGHAS